MHEARKVSQLVVALYTAIEKGLKGQLASADEALTIVGLDGAKLQQLCRTQREQGAPTLLSVRAKVDTHGPTASAHILNSLRRLPLQRDS